MTEIALRQPEQATTLHAQMDYARAVSTAHMLPENYRGKPADIMLAVGLGQAMGLSPAESLYRISVIKGKPTASAELIAANVRKAGHRLRVRGDETTCTATIIRADDPDFEFTVTRDLAWAKQMGLADQPNYRKQPGTMLQWRAITAVARLACPEALYGVAYTSDEMFDGGDPGVAAPSGGLGAALAAQQPEPEVVDQDAADEPAEGDAKELTDHTRRTMFALLSERGVTDRDAQIAGISAVIGRQIESRAEVTEPEAQAVIASLRGA